MTGVHPYHVIELGQRLAGARLLDAHGGTTDLAQLIFITVLQR
jgi:hypothetical protein